MGTLKELLKDFLEKQKGWVNKGELLGITYDKFGYSPETAGRLLRKMVSEEIVLVDYYKGVRGRMLAKYKLK